MQVDSMATKSSWVWSYVPPTTIFLPIRKLNFSTSLTFVAFPLSTLRRPKFFQFNSFIGWAVWIVFASSHTYFPKAVLTDGAKAPTNLFFTTGLEGFQHLTERTRGFTRRKARIRNESGIRNSCKRAKLIPCGFGGEVCHKKTNFPNHPAGKRHRLSGTVTATRYSV